MASKSIQVSGSLNRKGNVVIEKIKVYETSRSNIFFVKLFFSYFVTGVV
jgi:hypothetical protein